MYRQNQTVIATNFRIDNITPSTRFSELPDQAQKELDELFQYIRSQGQKCEYILKHGRQHVDTIQKGKSQTEALEQVIKGKKRRWEELGCPIIMIVKSIMYILTRFSFLFFLKKNRN